jgi:hypothetical protein
MALGLRPRSGMIERMKAVPLYLRLRRAYRKHGVLPYPRAKTWGEARFAERLTKNDEGPAK